MFKKLLALVMICAISFCGYGDVLLWQVDESTKVDGSSIQQFLVPYPSDDDHFPAARVKVVDGSTSTILKIYAPDEDGNWGWQDGDWGVWLTDDGGGHWGAYYN